MIKKGLKVIGIFILLVVLLLFLFWAFRFVSPSEVDDVSPEIICPIGIIEKSDVLWVIPEFEGYSIADNKDWCEYILSLDKEIGMHGVYHSYLEFNETRSEEYLMEGVRIFEECFGFKPEKFKPPQLKISEENIKLVEENGMDVKARLNQVTRKVYHCNDEPEAFSNEVIGII